MDLSVAIVNFNTRAILERTLAAVLADTSQMTAEVLVVDNASRDGSATMVRERFPAVTLLANTENRYYAAGNNQAMAASSGRYVLVLNPDAEPRPGTLPAMVAYLDRRLDVGALSVQMCFPDGRVQHNCARLPDYQRLLLEYTALGLVFRTTAPADTRSRVVPPVGSIDGTRSRGHPRLVHHGSPRGARAHRRIRRATANVFH